jgi:hypothetical protein
MPGQNAKSLRQVSEGEVKAAFLLNFLRFVEWPTHVLARSSTFNICVAGLDPFEGALERMVQGERIEGRMIAVEYVRRWKSSCQAFFVGASEVAQAQLLAGVSSGVLTVGEGTSFLRDGGMIALVTEQRKVRFDVNLPATQRGGVVLRSQLLEVARRVER